MNPIFPLPQIDALDDASRAPLQHLIDHKTKPPGSLGQLETLALQLGRIQRTTAPRVVRPVTIVFAADHGIAAEGVSPYPQAVTAQMVANFLAGGAAINAFSGVADCLLEIVNAGVASPLPASSQLIDVPVAAGTRNFAHERAMSRDQLAVALAAGAARARHHAALGTNVIGFGEMGIANTSAAACLMSRLLPAPLDACVGRGTGLDDAGLAHKRAVLERALARHPDALEPFDVLATFGGFEIAMMTGAMLAAGAARMTILVDGFIATSALLVAAALAPAVRDYCVFSHASNEAGHRRMLEHFGARPLLALDLRLGEGTGAALALPLVRAAAAFVNEMASFEAAGVANRDA
ncbi:nicotinate-nucleotide--dimethylbenzimidazole phosphoribosyltransferase [Burkholderia alba]|uniref:nicotinate-nucleotide--dimethylbenzimidazole phosphoribosyltransferase n=1 Tax=Burkholderia alba TaxID=2683677 RepID=UPI002B060AE0|nr:nicotinate-nucleotide--dimethylbenzimidazole phosphoribosyltransferase [Burkholderia alba]